MDLLDSLIRDNNRVSIIYRKALHKKDKNNVKSNVLNIYLIRKSSNFETFGVFTTHKFVFLLYIALLIYIIYYINFLLITFDVFTRIISIE